jgi:hypothetical protein
MLVLDTIPPVALCRDTFLYLDSFGQVLLSPMMVNPGSDRESTPDWAKHFNDLEGGSYDECGVAQLLLSKQIFTKAEIGRNQVTLTAVDPGGNTDECKAWVTIYDKVSVPVETTIVNTSPTMADIQDIAIVKEPLSFDVSLTGITPGKETNQKVVSVMASSDNPGLLTRLVVTYVSGETTGILKISLASGISGEALVTVMLTDNGGTANGGVNSTEVSFRVKVNAGSETLVVTITDPAGTPVTTDVLNLEDEFAITMFPNPTKGKVNIDLNWKKITEIDLRVYSVLGVEVYHKLYKAGDQISFNMAPQTSGLYLVELNIEGVAIVHKLILDRK